MNFQYNLSWTARGSSDSEIPFGYEVVNFPRGGNPLARLPFCWHGRYSRAELARSLQLQGPRTWKQI